MPFTKGDPNINTAGRKKGSKNKNTLVRMDQIREITDELYRQLMDGELAQLSPNAKANLFVQLISFQLPKVRAHKFTDGKMWRNLGESWLDDFDQEEEIVIRLGSKDSYRTIKDGKIID